MGEGSCLSADKNRQVRCAPVRGSRANSCNNTVPAPFQWVRALHKRVESGGAPLDPSWLAPSNGDDGLPDTAVHGVTGLASWERKDGFFSLGQREDGLREKVRPKADTQ